METLSELLSLLKLVSNQNGTAAPYIVGGVPRNILLNKNSAVKDIDITTGNEDVSRLADEFAKSIGKVAIHEGKHTKVVYGELSFDFSTNFIYPNIDDELSAAGHAPARSLLEKETYSRDFTVNTLLLDMDMKKLLDLTGQGKSDIDNLIIRCPLDCAKSFIYSPIRILRAFKLKAKYGMSFHHDVIDAINKHSGMVKTINDDAVTKIMNSIYEADPSIIDEMIEMGVMQKLPMTKGVTQILLKKRRILEVLP